MGRTNHRRLRLGQLQHPPLTAIFRESPLGPQAVLYAILDEVVDQYEPVVAGLENEIDEVEDELFGLNPDVTWRIYELSREIIEFQRATHPLHGCSRPCVGGPEGRPGPGVAAPAP